MHGLKIYTGNHMEILAEQLARIVREPLSSPLAPEIIVVQSRGMERWVSLELARHNGICANCRFPFPNVFLEEIFKKLIQDLPDESPFDPVTMTFRIMKLLPSCIHLSGFESLEKYLLDDIKGLKLFQLSEKIADLYDQYLVFRPDMMLGWEKGKENHWQAQLWRQLSPPEENRHRARLRKIIFEKIRKQPHPTEKFPGRVSIFGISYLPPFHIEAFVEISRLSQVNLFLMNPCREYWADIVSDQETVKIRKRHVQSDDVTQNLYLEAGNRLLAGMGALGRNFFSMISGLDCQTYEVFDDPHGHTRLSRIQSDILNLKNRTSSRPQNASAPENDPDSLSRYDSDGSVQIHSCHSPMREIEVLHDNLLAMFEEDPGLLPKDIVVMTPDIELYAPFIQAVFDAQTDETLRIPFTIADRNVVKQSRIIDGLMSILDLKNSRLGVASVMALMELSEIRDTFGLSESEIEIAERWFKETHIRWGIDAKYRQEKGLPGFSENTWKAGIDRLLLGYAMPGYDRKTFSGILPYDHIEGGDVKTLGKLIKFLDRVFACVQSLDTARTFSGWHIFFDEIIAQFFSPDEDSERDIHILSGILDDMSKKEASSGFDARVEIEVVRSYLERRLEHEQFHSRFFSGGVTFCAMLPMRSIPFKIVCLVGMNSDAFPRKAQTLGFDLMVKNPRMGDRNRRNDDKYLFLEALLSARNRLYVSYVGQSIQDNTRIPPSVLVSELIDYIKDGFGILEEQIVTLHRLQAFSPEYFKPGGKLFSYSQENFSAGSRLHGPKEASTLIAAKLPELSHKWKTLDIEDLSTFFGNPSRFLLEKRLGVYFRDPEAVADERENFDLDHLEKYLIDQELASKKMSGLNLKDYYSVKKASGQLPHGKVGEFVFNDRSLDAEDFVRKIEGHIKSKRLDDQGFKLDIAGFRLTGRMADFFEQGLIQIRYAKIKAKHLINTWIYHLVLYALDEVDNPDRSLLLGKDAAWEFKPVPDATDRISDLLRFYWKGMSEPLHFFPESSLEYVRQIQLMNRTKQAAIHAARKKWAGSDFARGESEDPYFERCFGKIDPLDEVFENIATETFLPLLNHSSEIVL
jgi:exodeoxyribonuclease V gamma subunit